MSNTTKRIIVGTVLAAIMALAALFEHNGIHAVRYLGLLVVTMMIIEMVMCIIRTPRAKLFENHNWLVFGGFLLWLIFMLVAVNDVARRPWTMLWLLLIICAADIGAWGFGTLLGGDKMWERLSAHKTWSGQIAGIVCGTVASIMYGMLGTDMFWPPLMWIGISVALLSQYGDLTASWVKRRLGIKDFGTMLPGHGGVLDRFDGWIYVLPLIWMVI